MKLKFPDILILLNSDTLVSAIKPFLMPCAFVAFFQIGNQEVLVSAYTDAMAKIIDLLSSFSIAWVAWVVFEQINNVFCEVASLSKSRLQKPLAYFLSAFYFIALILVLSASLEVWLAVSKVQISTS